MSDDSYENIFGALAAVCDTDGMVALPADTKGVLLQYPTDAMLKALAARLPELHHIITDGNAQHITNDGVAALRSMHALESLDLEWSAVTDTALADLMRMPALRWVDLGGTLNVSAAAIEKLRERRPDLEIEIH